MAGIKNVEIMRVGIWNRTKFTLKHLQSIAANFLNQDFDVPLKLGHTNAPDAPAFGWVRNVRLQGERLVADFEDIPEKVFGLIRDKMFNNVSVEIFFDFERGGKKFDRVLSAVALLGAQIPAVSKLTPLADSIKKQEGPRPSSPSSWNSTSIAMTSWRKTANAR